MQNKAIIDRANADEHPAKGLSNRLVKNAADMLKPHGCDYQGSVVLHYYRVPNTNDFAFITSIVDMKTVEEGQADVGFKELQRSIMATYGKEPKKVRS